MELFISLLIFVVLAVFILITAAAYTTLAERVVCAWIQQRKGPNRVGWFGLLQPLADGIKLLLKEDIVPKSSNRGIHFLAPVMATALAVCGIAMLPFAKGLQILDVNIGILYILGVSSIAVYAITLAGWSSNSKYSLLGGLRSSAQMISYELSLGLALVSVILLTNHITPAGGEYLKVSAIVEAQRNVWFIFINPVAGFIFITCAFAELNRAPFDLVEAEQELVGGYHTEYSSMKFGSFFVGEYLNVVIMSGFISTFFFGGYLGPFEGTIGVANWSPLQQTVWGIGWFAIKTMIWIFIMIWVRWTLPRFKYNQLMDIGWKSFLRVAIVNIMVVAGVLVVIQNWNTILLYFQK